MEWPEGGTTPVAKSVWSQGLKAIINESQETDGVKEECTALLAAVEGSKKWRKEYLNTVFDIFGVLMRCNSDSLYAHAQASMDTLLASFMFKRDGQSMPFTKAMSGDGSVTLQSVADQITVVKGTMDKEAVIQIEAPLILNDGRKTVMSGDTLVKQMKRWTEYGSAHTSCGTNMEAITALPNSDLKLNKKLFVMLGGTSEFCPIRPLLKLGATVICIARPGKKIEALVAEAKLTTGTLIIPGPSDGDDYSKCGADLLAQTPEIAAFVKNVWNSSHNPGWEQVVVGTYAYLDAEKHVRVVVAMDTIFTSVQRLVGAAKIALAQIASPALPTIWPVGDMDHAAQAFKESSGISNALWGLADNVSNCGKRPEAGQYGVFNGLIDMQGPNYALAKTSQNWRAVLALRAGSIVSSNFAPAGRTQSMLHSSTMAKVLDGMQAFPPALVLYPDTVSAIMGALLLYDITIPEAKANPKNAKHDHPYEYQLDNAFHGGGWRSPYSVTSCQTAIYLLGMVGYYPGTAAILPELAQGP